MDAFLNICNDLKRKPRRWLVTGVAGFVGSNILEALLNLKQHVIGLDNLSTGTLNNLEEIQARIDPTYWSNFTFINGDICDIETCRNCCKQADIVLHQAALGSVPRSIENPIITNTANIDGFLNILTAAKDERVKGFVYAASSSTYGDHPDLPKVEKNIGSPLSPYAVTKYVNELYATVYKKTYDFNSIGLRYFNVFGPRQSPKGAYAAVIPKWIEAIIQGKEVKIFGDGETSRDFCYVENVIQANILAGVTENKKALNEVYNIAFNESTSLNDLFKIIIEQLESMNINYNLKPIHSHFRDGDVRHSLADISKAKELLEYDPQYSLRKGIGEAMPWYVNNVKNG